MDSTTAGSGDELVPTQEAAALWLDVNLETMVAPLFSRTEMPSDPFDIPLQLGDVSWYPGTENSAVTGSALATAKQTLTSYELVGQVPWSLSLDEDSVVAMASEVRSSLVRNAAEVIDDVLLNADTTATNNINADGATISKSDVGKGHWLLGIRWLGASALGGQHQPSQRPRRLRLGQHVQRDTGQAGQVRGASLGTSVRHGCGHLHT